ncbi:hypothetical protein FGSG_13410 [Fusarium graminearum PH-1]|uniref:hypothetical protein n=1 Tax=Gibberella zeae (strain ATCC MYA-4620 / CBS 123657 / FGSC 9075 / NRRL 31084 / PH-1) TaxID=229533 RepID=UPI00021F1D36|nr:hypothetical protein FGSG_13410 [Fusarium graminearum PH-1]ESU15118.1 hypothetical protein FGSG_13410 [Fusarium graminearum PH-1]|eukprot:XP_011320543.1 hypothetical protein FGSG_13410 [Fusarium graminearum PH-1]
MSDLLDEITALEQASDDISSNRRHRYQVARGFLWTAWQRWIQLSTYYLFGTRLLRRCNPEDWYPALPPEYDELELGTVGNSLKVEDQTEKACNYMCRHSYYLVRLSAPGTLDLRTLVLRYNDQFGNKRARCHQRGADWLHCDAAAAFCQRCVTSTPEDQSTHDQACSNKQCQKLMWDRNSYLSTEAPRAVDLSLSDSNSTKCLRYRKAAGQTLAISHVWGHGQGGRPEDGFNECLHNRYSAIALNLGCDSYWIDAACIPSDEHLRSEAIKTINPTFRESKVTLICDRDVMDIDIGSQSLSKEQCERLISVLLLSDWNIRAWTLLEGIRGNRAIHVLCKNNNPVPLKDFLVVLYERGSIDLCGVLLGSPHLLPMGQEISTVELEKAGTMLSRRFASRPGDEMVIWSLLCGDDTAEKRLERFWKGRLRVPIKSGFLMSTSDRVKGIRGLSWAPSSPFARPMELNVSSPDPAIYASYDGNGTIAVKLLDEKVSDCNTALHLRGDWCVYIVQPSDLEDLSAVPNSCWERAKQLLSSGEYKRVIFVRPVFSRAHVVAGDEIPFLRPTTDAAAIPRCDQYQVQLKIIYDCISRNFQYNIMSSPSSSSFTREQIWEEWKNCGTQPEERRDTTSSFICHDIREIDIDGQWFKERDAPQKTGNDRPSSKPRMEEERIVDRAFDLLSRLPDTPIPLFNHPVLPGDQSKHGWLKIGGDTYVWEDLEVVHTTSAIVIRMALSIAATWDRSPKTNVRGKELHMFRKFLDFTSELIDSTTYESEKPSFKSPGQQWRWFVLKAYLWSTWQRCVALHYWRILQDHLAIGFDYSDLSELALRPNLDSSLVSEKQTVLKSEYMCSLAYQILLRSRSTALLDLRQFHARFNDLFGSKPGRCNNRKSCDGESPARCRRMQGAMIVDQSQHDLLCSNPTNCNRILWNEESYRQVTGGRAVSIAACSDVSQVTLLYEGASPQTLTISHVWSHGQGGRPESGLNACLHARYSVIARKFGCSSYWIDAACE